MLASAAKLFDPEGHITPFAIQGQNLFNQLFISQPEDGWDTPITREEVAEYQAWIKNAEQLQLVTIATARSLERRLDEQCLALCFKP